MQNTFQTIVHGAFATAACILLLLTVGCSHSNTGTSANSWNPKAAAAYLDRRESWWADWFGAARDHETFCVSCHTALPYALSRPSLRKVLSEEQLAMNERNLLDNVTKRVRLWDKIDPYYEAGLYKAAQSRGTEAILNTVILASYDAQHGQLSPDTRTAFKHMWSLQRTEGDGKGSWPWLEFGHLEPWESDDSQFYGATLAAIAVGIAPENYRLTPEIQNNLALLRSYLRREQSSQSTINRVALLWASTKLPGLIEGVDREAIVRDVLRKQQKDGGWRLAEVSWVWRGWTLSSFRMWMRRDGTWVERASDGYATGLIALALEESGLSSGNPQLQRSLSWLEHNQEAQGSWHSSSLNKKRAPSSNIGLFMSDAATAYAVLALTESSSQTNTRADSAKPSFVANK
jgi:squalene-hopene/tetraprenyl-beta-curcumene cyclase